MSQKSQQNQSQNQLKTNPLQKIEHSLFFLTVLFLPTQLGKHFWPPFSYIYSLKIDYLSPIIYFWDILMIFLLLTFLLQKPKIKNKNLFILLFFLSSQALSLIFAANLYAGFVRLEQLVLVSLFGFYLSQKNLNGVKNILLISLSAALLLESLLAISQFLLSRSVGLWILGERKFILSTPSIANFNWYGQIFLRPYATFPHPNVLAAYIVLSISIILFLANFKKILFKTTLLLAILTGILTFSRAAMAVLFLQTLFIFKNRFKLLLMSLLVILPFIFIRFNSALNFDSLSITRREELAGLSVNLFLSKPILGVGLNNFINQISSVQIAGPSRFLQPVHNIFLLTLSETGVVGFLGLMLFLIYPLWRLREVESRYTKYFIMSLFSITIFLGMFDHYFLTLAQGQRLLFFIWGLSLSIISTKM